MKFTDREWRLVSDLIPEGEDAFTVVLDALVKLHALDNASLVPKDASVHKSEQRIVLNESDGSPDAMEGPESIFDSALGNALHSFD